MKKHQLSKILSFLLQKCFSNPTFIFKNLIFILIPIPEGIVESHRIFKLCISYHFTAIVKLAFRAYLHHEEAFCAMKIEGMTIFRPKNQTIDWLKFLINHKSYLIFLDADTKCAIYPRSDHTLSIKPDLLAETLFVVKTWSANHHSRLKILQNTWTRHAKNIVYASDLVDPNFGTTVLPGAERNTFSGHCRKTASILKARELNWRFLGQWGWSTREKLICVFAVFQEGLWTERLAMVSHCGWWHPDKSNKTNTAVKSLRFHERANLDWWKVKKRILYCFLSTKPTNIF